MKFFLSFPEMWARTTWPGLLISSTLNIVPGKTATTFPSTSMALASAMVGEWGRRNGHHDAVRRKIRFRLKAPCKGRTGIVSQGFTMEDAPACPFEKRFPSQLL